MALNLEKQLAFYGSYHNNSTNVAIHMIFVPLILITWIGLLTNSGPIFPLPSALTIPNLPANLGTLWAVGYILFYLLLEPFAGAMMAPLLLGGTAYVQHLISTYGMTANYWALGLHVSSWIAQFIGHGKFEGRAPALLDSIVQAIVLAPLFVFIELLFLLGYRPDLQKRVGIEVDANLRKWRAEKGGKVVANGNGKVR